MAFWAKLSWAASGAHQGAAAAAGVPFSDCCVALHNGELLAAYGGMAACFPSRMAGLAVAQNLYLLGVWAVRIFAKRPRGCICARRAPHP
jgi:hypothetical protein